MPRIASDDLSVMSVVSLFRRMLSGATPENSQKEGQADPADSDRHMKDRNYPEAEKCLMSYLSEGSGKRYSAKRKLEIWLDLADAQRFQGKQAEARDSFASALKLIESNKLDGDSKALCLDRLAQYEADRGNGEEFFRAAQEAVDLTSSSKKPDLNLLATRVHALAVAEGRSGRQEDSKATFRKAMNLYEQAYWSGFARGGRAAGRSRRGLPERGQTRGGHTVIGACPEGPSTEPGGDFTGSHAGFVASRCCSRGQRGHSCGNRTV